MIYTQFTTRPARIIPVGFLLLLVLLYLSFGSSLRETPIYDGLVPASLETAALCRSHGFQPYQTHGVPRKVYDLFLLSTELDWLEIRLNTLAPYVDYFVIVESATTFTNLPKPLYLADNWANFSSFHDKIIHRVVEDPGEAVGSRTWDHEDFMRNALIDKVFPSLAGTPQLPNEGDALVVSDVDEIPKPDTLTALRHCEFPPRLTLRSHFYYYSFQWLHRGNQWQHPQATVYRGPHDTIPPQNLRIGDGGHGFFLFRPLQRWRQRGELRNAAWHCSSCFATLREMRTKMESFSHTSYNTEQNRDSETIVERVRNGWDLFGRRGQYYDRVENNADVPPYVLDRPDKFRYMLNRDGSNAAFQDYE